MAKSPTVNCPAVMAWAAATRMIPVPMLTEFQKSDSRIWVRVLSRTRAARRVSLRLRKWAIIGASAPATLIAGTAPNISDNTPVTCPVAARAVSR